MENQELSNTDLATIAVYNLGGAFSPVELEDVAIEIFNLAPKRFSWKKYIERIDLRIVLYAVNDAIKPDIGFIKGNSKYGYMLTEAGVSWVNDNKFSKIEVTSSRKMSTTDISDKEKIRLEGTNAYNKFISGNENQITLTDFVEFTRVFEYFPKIVKDQKFAKIQNVSLEDETLKMLWIFLKQKFL